MAYKAMSLVYAELVKNNLKKIEDVPENLLAEVKEILGL